MRYSTKELLDMFFDEYPRVQTKRNILDREELYSYEKQTGKELKDMSSEDILGLVKAVYCKTPDCVPNISTCDNFLKVTEKFFDWYARRIYLRINPCDVDFLKGMGLRISLTDKENALSFAKVQRVIDMIRENEGDKADYYELVILLFYNGFRKAEEITTMQESMIDHENRKVYLRGKTVQLSDRCYELLNKVHNLSSVKDTSYDKYYDVISWRDSYFKFIVLPSCSKDFDDKDINEVNGKISLILTDTISKKYSIKLTAVTLYWLGFYDYMIEQIGRQNANKAILASRDAESKRQIETLAKMYGIQVNNSTMVSRIRSYVFPYVTEEWLLGYSPDITK